MASSMTGDHNADADNDEGSVAGPSSSAVGTTFDLGDQTIQENPDTFDIGSPRGVHPMVGRLSTTSYPNESVDPDTGKWIPRHAWTETHDQLYARLCYAILLFKSPRKSNFVILKGKRWFVNWANGHMIRVLPPAYGEVELFGPWQTITTENRFI
jgi:hypothetical protein